MGILFSGHGNPKLAQSLSESAHLKLGQMDLGRFSNDNIYVEILEDVRGQQVFVLQSPTCPVSDHILEMFIILDALRRLRPKEVHLIIPYFPYSRSDKLDKLGNALTARLMADIVSLLGVSSLATFDLHAKQIEGFLNIPVYHLTCIGTLAQYFVTLQLDPIVVFSPDSGGLARARKLADLLGAGTGFIHKKRVGKDQTAVLDLVGDPRGCNVVICDDEIDTGGSQIKAATALKEAGAQAIYGAYSHGILSGSAIAKIGESDFEQIVITDTMRSLDSELGPKIRIVSIVSVLADWVNHVLD